ncbi:hypothetical protein PCE1_002057 [Barthelona sp. PCE]
MQNNEPNRVGNWLRRAGLDQYVPMFYEEAINEESFMSLSMQDYANFGVTAIQDRKQLFRLIQSLKQDETARPDEISTSLSLEPVAPSQSKDAWLYSAANDESSETDDEYHLKHEEEDPELLRTIRDLPEPSPERIRVVVRKRPISNSEIERGEVDVLEIDGEDRVGVLEPKVRVDLTRYTERHIFDFDTVFDEEKSNQYVYDTNVRPLLRSFFRGEPVTIFAYGQTGAGKTYTMLESHGLLFKSLTEIFDLLGTARFQNYEVHIAFFEIYAEQVYDLLNNRKQCIPREDHKGRVQIAGLTRTPCNTERELRQLVDRGINERITGSTGQNDVSSRSHGILEIVLINKDTRKKEGIISFIDLAGSERAKDSYFNDKVRREEAKSINSSLLALKECIRSLFIGKKHVPFRQSKLTLILRKSFMKNSKTLMICCISPCDSQVENSMNTLRYASRVKSIDGDKREKKAARRRIAQGKADNRRARDIKDIDRDREREREQNHLEREREMNRDHREKEPVRRERRENLPKLPDYERVANDDLSPAGLLQYHRQSVDLTMELLKMEMKLLHEMDGDGNVRDYVQKLKEILSQKNNLVSSLQRNLNEYTQKLRNEELSKRLQRRQFT